jgi:hypothetical protein
MKKLCISCALLCACMSSVFAGEAPNVITRNLKLWAPLKVDLTKGVLTIVSKEARVTDRIYIAMMGSGVCGSLWMNPGSWKGVKMVRILNRHSFQGWVFEGGAAECDELGKYSGKEFELQLMGKTHLGRD